MKDWDDEIHRALGHPIRRRIIECLQENNLSFHELLKRVGIRNHGKLGFHIKALRGLVEREPSMKKYRLTDRGQLAGELIWDIRFIIERGGRDLAHEPTRYVRRLRFRDHAILYYDTEDVKHEITFSFLVAGLPKGEAVVYVVSEHKLDSEGQAIQRYGISVDHFRRGAFTIMSAEEWFLRKGKVQAKTIIDNWLTFAKEKQKAGFTGLRGAAEMEFFFNYAKAKEALRLEAALGRQLPPNLCGLCLYDTHRLDEKQFIQLKKSHGHLIFKGMAWVVT
ncbi:MAG: MEDS domain-containing protein [Candidatus Bathyarchaeia archaeon]